MYERGASPVLVSKDAEPSHAEETSAKRRDISIIAFDIDGTLIVHPSGKVVWQIFNEIYGTAPEVNTARYRRHIAGDLSYAEWVDLDVGDWQRAGAKREEMEQALGEFVFVDGARRALRELRRRGYGLVAISGTIDILVDTLFPEHPFERVFTNQIHFAADGSIAGWTPTPFDFHGKRVALEQVSKQTNVPLEAMAFVGDDINDVEVARAAGFAVAVRPRTEALVEVCDVVLRDEPLTRLLDHFPPRA